MVPTQKGEGGRKAKTRGYAHIVSIQKINILLELSNMGGGLPLTISQLWAITEQLSASELSSMLVTSAEDSCFENV